MVWTLWPHGGPTPAVSIPEGTYAVSLRVADDTSQSLFHTITINMVSCFDLTARPKLSKVQLTWTHQEESDLYQVYRSDAAAPGNFAKIAETNSTYATYLDETTQIGITYLYVVNAMVQGTSCYSAVVSAHPTDRRGARDNHAPVIYSAPILSASKEIVYTYDVNASDPNGDTLSYSLIAFPAGMTIESTSGLISWTPPSAQVGDNPVTIQVTDDGIPAQSTTQSFTITVTDVNQAPTISSFPVTTATEDQSYTYDVEAEDPDTGDSLTFLLDQAPASMTIDPKSRS